MKIAAFFASFVFSDNCGDFCEVEHNSCVSNAFCDNLDCNSQCYRQFANCLDECTNDKTILILKTHSDPVWNHSFNWGGQATEVDFTNEFGQLSDSQDDHYIGGVDIVGGELVSFGGKGVASTEIYDRDSRSWSFLDNIDDEISYLFYTSSVVIDGGAEMIVFGGYTNEGFTYPKSTDLTWRLRVDSSGQYIWRRGERLLQPRDSHTAIRNQAMIIL
ncbi:Oidioi.mRNA.OKI2018_I69.chr2.g4946.t1.cds [Oikopleura dioica]|uniref:Oidioi.mRNA.OKI2018_I69.chr2.g4946.t1.cds n=1 Tax=Oikopleura dioica TaxID=34765 RepID=A0ABN7T284_OIKDI|nr:Oidioi.mRNA.OKI2018_I69.chr2.g4946.t1.cds [Oikopleura dioica]